LNLLDAVVPVAGLGTRLLPATKSQPKEMLPVVGKPVVQYVVEELAAVGVDRVLFVTGRGKSSIEDHFDPDRELIQTLRTTGREQLLAELEYERMGVEFLYTRQADPLGLGDAVLCAERFAAERPFALALGDSILGRDRRSAVVRTLAGALDRADADAAIAVERVPSERASLYGIAVPAGGGEPGPGDPFPIVELVEKPAAGELPGTLAVAARYVLSPAIFEALRSLRADPSGEIELTEALGALIAAGATVLGVMLPPEERRYDVGTVEGYCRTFLEFALADPRFGERLRAEFR
jgi:UTP--glucose-1-phosphate uridylyltransferase